MAIKRIEEANGGVQYTKEPADRDITDIIASMLQLCASGRLGAQMAHDLQKLCLAAQKNTAN